ncbi:EF-P 5-aminopentanol modification-associated protein YfmF, partial [Streptococcus pyogenes]
LIRQQWSDMRSGYFTDEDLELSKKMLMNAATLAQDRMSTLIEQAYNQSIYGEDNLSYDKWIKSVKLVSREEVMAVAKLMKL